MKRTVEFVTDTSLAEQCFLQLQDEIIQGIFLPGEKLKIEPIKERFAVGQSPVREALCRLTALGLVQTEENKGFRVAMVSQADVRDVFAVMTAVELLALEWAMKHGDAEWEAGIVAELHKLSLVELVSQPGSYELWSKRNYDFHLALISACNSPMLLELRRNIYLKFDRYCQMSYQFMKRKTLPVNHEEHKKLVDAVLKRNVLKAQDLMKRHINDSLEDVIEQFRKHKMF